MMMTILKCTINLTKRKVNESTYFYHWQARSRLSSASYALPRKKHIADLIWQASITVVSNHLTTRKTEEECSGREAAASHIDLMIFSILIKINVTAIILINDVSMLIQFCIPKHQQTLMPLFQLLLKKKQNCEVVVEVQSSDKLAI